MEGRVGGDVLEVAVQRSAAGGTGGGSGGRKRIRVNGVGRRAGALGRHLRVVLFAPEEMLLVVGSPSLRRAAMDALAAARSPAYADDLGTYGRTLQQRNSLLRAIREEQASRDELRFWDESFLDTGGRVVTARLELLDALADPLAAAHREIAPDEAAAGGLTLRYVSERPGAPRARRRATRWRGDWPTRRRRRSGTAPRSSGRTATTWHSTSLVAIWPDSRRAASSAPRSWPSSSPSSTC